MEFMLGSAWLLKHLAKLEQIFVASLQTLILKLNTVLATLLLERVGDIWGNLILTMIRQPEGPK